jgi:hypothetical protein
MSWVYLDDHFDENRKILDVFSHDPQAVVLFVAGLGYCARTSTNGSIPSAKVRWLLGYRPKAYRALLDAGLWHKDGPDQDVRVHDWEEWNRTSNARSASARNAAKVRWAMRPHERPDSDPQC